ncbi:MAG: hypothetical protein JWM80_3484 [Cyanobacteria bacterium RYN_339]|nr:hypothetical protein [Cyanobacteria bacterium RYN_339]
MRSSLPALDAYLASLVQAAGEVEAGITLSRRLAKSALQAKLRLAIAHGDAPKTLAELQAFAAAYRTRWKLVRQAQRLAAAPRARANRSAERMFPPDQVAREVGVSEETVAAWCRQGWLRAENAATEPRVPDSALHAFRAAQARWKRLVAVAAAAREDMLEPTEAAIFAELAARG